jgi:hypothetical protein
MFANFVIGAVAMAIAVSATPQAPATPQSTLRVFVETDDIGEPAELGARRTSVRDLEEALASKKKTITVVKDEDKADIVIEVIERAIDVPRVVFGIGARPGQPPGGAGPVRTALLRVRLTMESKDVTVVLSNKNKASDNPRGWKSAADDLADQINKKILELR